MDAGNPHSLGYGQLGAYAIRSNTFASKLVHHVLGDKWGATPPEGATGTVLEPLRYNATVAQLLALGPAPAPLAVIAKFMAQVAQIFANLLSRSGTSTYHWGARVVMLQQTTRNAWRILVEDSSGPSGHRPRAAIYAEHVVLALGAFQKLPKLDQRHHQLKLLCSNEVLSPSGLKKMRSKLGLKHGKICIVGGAHSAFSTAWLCLHGENAQFHSSTLINSASSPQVKRVEATRPAPMPPCCTSSCHLLLNSLGSNASSVRNMCMPNTPNASLTIAHRLPAIDAQSLDSHFSFSRETHAAVCPNSLNSGRTYSASCVRTSTGAVEGDTSSPPDMQHSHLPLLELTTTSRSDLHHPAIASPSETAAQSTLSSSSGPLLSITILHRSPVRVFYISKREADADGYRDYKQTNRHGQVHAFAGLRGDAKNFFNQISRGREPRVRLCQVKPGGSKSLITRCFEEAHVVVWATGYESHVVPIHDKADTQIHLRMAQGQVQVDRRGRVVHDGTDIVDESDAVLNLYGNGHGYGLPAIYENGELDGSKGRADGIAVYMKHAASVILYEIFGDAYPGPTPHNPPLSDKPHPPKTSFDSEKQLAHVDRLCQPKPPIQNFPLSSTNSGVLSSSKQARTSKRHKCSKKVTSNLSAQPLAVTPRAMGNTSPGRK